MYAFRAEIGECKICAVDCSMPVLVDVMDSKILIDFRVVELLDPRKFKVTYEWLNELGLARRREARWCRDTKNLLSLIRRMKF